MEKDKTKLIRDTLAYIIDLFEFGDVPEAIKMATFPPYEKPSNYWSLANRILMMLHDTDDARTFKQWQKCERKVEKGQKAFHIFAPRKVKIKDKDGNGEKIEKYILTGFLLIPVFRLEQTDGKSIHSETLSLPELPLIEKANEWNIDVSTVAFDNDFYGCYLFSKGDESKEKIRLATSNETVFFHELAHASHQRVLGRKLKNKQDCEQEIVAELSAQVLSQIVGTQLESTLGNSYQYVKSYASKMNKDIGVACLSVLSQIEKVLNLILESPNSKGDLSEKNKSV